MEDNREKNSIYSKRVKAGKRTYFFDVRATRANDYFLTITESRKRFDNNGYDRHKIFLYKEDFNKFLKSITEAVDYVKTELMPDFDFDAFNHEESYDADGKINYFTARSFNKDSFIKFKNPEVSRDIIANELFINWDLPIIICEGMFDALAIKRNVIPLLGKNIQNSLMKKLITSKVKKIYIALDKDAIKQSVKFCENLINEGKEVYLVKIDGKDPSELGFNRFTELIQHTNPLSYFDLMEVKLSL